MCQSCHVLLFCEVKSLPWRYLLLCFCGRPLMRSYIRPSESGLGATRTAHRSARLSAPAPPPATSHGIRGRARMLLYFCLVLWRPTHQPWCCGQDAVGAPLASVDSRGSPSARLALFALCPSRAGGGGAFVIIYHLLPRRPLSRH